MILTPDWFTVPAETIATDSTLEGYYLNAAATHEDFVNKIEAEIPLACAYVGPRLRAAIEPYNFPFTLEQLATAYPNDTDEGRAARRDQQTGLACEAAKQRVIWGLFRMLPGTDNQNIAEGCKKAADEIIATLTDPRLGDLVKTAQALAASGKPNRNGYGMLSMGRAPATGDPWANAILVFDAD